MEYCISWASERA